GQHAEADRAWDRAFALDTDPRHINLRANKAVSLARTGDLAGAAAEAEALARSEAFAAACGVLAEASKAAAKKGDRAQAETYAARAVALLRQALQSGKTTPADLKETPFLAPLRDREDFHKLLAEWEKKKASAGKPPS